MPKHYKNAKGNKKGSYNGPVTGPNAPSISGKKSGGSGNAEQTPEKVRSSYKNSRGG